jgi:hypothetical protein
MGTELRSNKSRHKDNSEIFRKPSIFFQVSWKVAIKISKHLGKFVNRGRLYIYFHHPFVNKM